MTTSPETEKAGVAELFKIYFPEVTLDERFCEAVQSYFQAHKEEALLSHGKEERGKAVEECMNTAHRFPQSAKIEQALRKLLEDEK